MSLLKIIANGIELDFVKETLTIKTENNVLSKDFKVSASSFPFLIIENRNTKIALGSRDLASVKKHKIVQVTVLEGNDKYFGELQILSFLNGFRKCNLKYSSEILSIINKKISEFMPVVSVIPDEENPVPFTVETNDIIEGSENWQTYPLPFLGSNFPDVKWQFPKMNWFNKYGVALDSTDDWFAYKNKINDYDENGLVLNTYMRNSDNVVVQNKNVASPQIFLFSPLFYALETLGYKAVGSAIENEFLKRVLFLSTKDNLTLTNFFKQIFPPLHYVSGGNFWNTSFQFDILTPGTYSIKYRFEELPFTGTVYVRTFSVRFAGTLIFAYNYLPDTPSQIFEGIIEFDVTGDEVSHQLSVQYSTQENVMPVYNLSLSNSDNKFYQMHPTIQLGRYLPDWTFGTYLNELQNLFNLEIVPDDYTKTLKINLNDDTIRNSDVYEIKKSLYQTSYDLQPYNAFLLKYDNDDDAALWITTEIVEDFKTQKSDFAENINSKFKFIPVSNTADLSEAIDSKSGVGLMIYDPERKPFVSPDFLGQTLKMNGEKGIYKVFWQKFLKFLLNSSAVELTGPFTETEKNNILKLKRIFIDHQEYLVSIVQCTETSQDNFNIKFNLYSITF